MDKTFLAPEDIEMLEKLHSDLAQAWREVVAANATVDSNMQPIPGAEARFWGAVKNYDRIYNLISQVGSRATSSHADE